MKTDEVIKWERTEIRTPPDDVLVKVITPGGDERMLVFYRGLWWLPDKSMYVYFVPTFWRLIRP